MKQCICTCGVSRPLSPTVRITTLNATRMLGCLLSTCPSIWLYHPRHRDSGWGYYTFVLLLYQTSHRPHRPHFLPYLFFLDKSVSSYHSLVHPSYYPQLRRYLDSPPHSLLPPPQPPPRPPARPSKRRAACRGHPTGEATAVGPGPGARTGGGRACTCGAWHLQTVGCA